MAVIDFLNSRVGGDSKKDEVGIGGFTLLARVNETQTLSSQVPTTWLEDGSFVHDHIILDPLTLSIEGTVSDVYVRREAAIEAITRIQAEVGNIQLYLPDQSVSQAQAASAIVNDATDQLRKLDRAIDSGEQALSLLSGESQKGLMEQFVDSMEALHGGRQLVQIDMPYRTYDNMRITSIQTTKDNQNDSLSFKILAQKIRFADIIYTDASEFFKNAAAGTDGKTDGESDKGPQKPKELEQSTLSYGLNTVKSLLGIN